MGRLLRALLFIYITPFMVFAQKPLIEVTKIWDRAPHNAFTDLIRFKDKFYCTFREGTGHVPRQEGVGDGLIRVITSTDGKEWESAVLLKKRDLDLRDPKLSVMPDGRLMLIMGASDYEWGLMEHRLPHVSFSDENGENFSDPIPIRFAPDIDDKWNWLWRVTWYEGVGYGVIYRLEEKPKLGQKIKVFLVKTTNGLDYDLVTPLELDSEGRPNEATIRMMPDGEMLMVMRREAGDQYGYLGRSRAPFTKWVWSDLKRRLGGPDFIQMPNGRLVFATRGYSYTDYYTSLHIGNKDGNLKEVYRLPSNNDTSYPGLVWHQDTLYISYYSGHEKKTSIYLAKVPAAYFQNLEEVPPIGKSEKIWAKAQSNSLSDLIRFNDTFYCVLREADNDNTSGKIRVLQSKNGKKWTPLALIEEKGTDLSHPKLSIAPDTSLMINCRGADWSDGVQEWHTRVVFSKDGKNWGRVHRVKGIPANNWFYRVHWQQDTAYVVANICKADYVTGRVITADRKMQLYRSYDGLNYDQVSSINDSIYLPPSASEASLQFKDDTTMVVLLRDDEGHSLNGLLLTSQPPYKDFDFRSIPHGMAGPNFLPFGDNNWLVVTQEFADERPGERKGNGLVLLSVDETGYYKRLLELPAKGETGHAGLLKYKDEVWISYHSKHEGKEAIYLSRIPISSIKVK